MTQRSCDLSQICFSFFGGRRSAQPSWTLERHPLLHPVAPGAHLMCALPAGRGSNGFREGGDVCWEMESSQGEVKQCPGGSPGPPREGELG